MATRTRNLTDHLASIAAQLDAILASMKKDIEEIKVKMIRDDCNSEESDNDLKNTVAEELRGCERDPLQKLTPGIDGVIKVGGFGEVAGGVPDRIDTVDDGNGGANGTGTDETDKIDGLGIEERGAVKILTEIDGTRFEELGVAKNSTEIDKKDVTENEEWVAAKKLTANCSHDRKRREEIGCLVERLVWLHRSLSLVVYKKLVPFINEDSKLNYQDCMMVVFFIIVWDPGKEIVGGSTGRKPTESEYVHAFSGSHFLPPTICRPIGVFGSPCNRGRVLHWCKIREYNNLFKKKHTTFGARCYIRAGLNSADFERVEITEINKPLRAIVSYSRTSFLIFDLRTSRFYWPEVMIQTWFNMGQTWAASYGFSPNSIMAPRSAGFRVVGQFT